MGPCKGLFGGLPRLLCNGATVLLSIKVLGKFGSNLVELKTYLNSFLLLLLFCDCRIFKH